VAEDVIRDTGLHHFVEHSVVVVNVLSCQYTGEAPGFVGCVAARCDDVEVVLAVGLGQGEEGTFHLEMFSHQVVRIQPNHIWPETDDWPWIIQDPVDGLGPQYPRLPVSFPVPPDA